MLGLHYIEKDIENKRKINIKLVLSWKQERKSKGVYMEKTFFSGVVALFVVTPLSVGVTILSELV